MSRWEHPLVGLDPILAKGMAAIVALVTLAAALQGILGAFVFVDDRLLGWVPTYDGFVGILIVMIGLSWLLAIAYAWANGGPALAVAMAYLPTLAGGLVRLEFAVTVDLALAAAAATIAVWFGAWISYPPDDGVVQGTQWMAALGWGVSGLAAVLAWQGAGAVGPYAAVGGVLAMAAVAVGWLIGIGWTGAILRKE